MKGATPVPGPIIIIGFVWSSGNLNKLLVIKKIFTLDPISHLSDRNVEQTPP